MSRAVVGPLIERRALPAILTAAAAAQVALTAWRLPGWPCAFREATGLPCPGCGLSNGVAALLRGDWSQAIAWHAFAPLVLAGCALLALAALLPDPARRALAARVGGLERRSGLSLALAAGFLLYWLARLLYTPLAPYPVG
jgi:hypothetical protein